MESREKNVLQDRGALPKEEGNVTRECQAAHEENFLSSCWLREEGKQGKQEITMEAGKETKEEAGKKRTREEEKEENETWSVGSTSVETFEIFSQEGEMESCGDFSGRNLLDKPEDLSDRESEVWVDVPVQDGDCLKKVSCSG